MSTPLKNFVKFNTTYHEVCSDKFDLDNLYKWLTPYGYTGGYIIENIRHGGPMFKALKSFCELSEETVNNAIDEFNETQLVTENLLTHDIFTSRIKSSLSDFKSMTPMQFLDLLMLIKDTTWANQFITIFRTNYQLIVRNDTGHVRPHPPEEELRTQRRMTRVYLFIVILAIGIITWITALTYQTKTISMNEPTFDVYQSLEQLADCPCANVSIPYHTFIGLKMSFHEVCSSDFTDLHSDWMAMLYSSFLHEIKSEDNVPTFQRMALSHFQALQAICETSMHSAKTELSLFLNSTFYSTSMIGSDVFQKQIDATLFNFKSNSLSSNYNHSLELIRSMYSSNAFISAFGTNWSPVLREVEENAKIYMQAQKYNMSSCSCATSTTCVETMKLRLESRSPWVVPGMLSGCLPLDSMLESTLECLYDQACIDMISDALNSTIRYTPLIADHTRFHPISIMKLDNITKQFFIEKWSESVSFEAYFNACHTEKCSYTISKRFNIGYISSTVIAFYGGLSVGLKLTIPLVFKIVKKCLSNRNSRRVISINTS
ncbi:unnamed protein product [Adineta steineri]|uniref:Uncharacterized protein n=1 Tax=Adineta steineri TaxID=433720 RepID=A0A814CNL2_9BILA|nr:unnamed protein product [Adineta steineri]CAF1203090.1 unnamed protein product [Adineta steineri]CAF1233636.1 unnamed protein product [Adineta steineri]